MSVKEKKTTESKSSAKSKKKTGRTKRRRIVKEKDLEPIYPWEQQPDESAKAFEAFEHYLKDGPLHRGVRKTGRDIGKYYSQIFDWSAKYDWLRRAEAYDRKESRQAMRLWENDRKKMHKRHANSAMAAMGAAMSTLNEYIPTKENPKPKTLRERDAIRLLDVAARLERLSRGEPDSFQKTEGEVKVTTNADEERASLIKLMEDPKGREHMAAISKLMGTDGSNGKR